MGTDLRQSLRSLLKSPGFTLVAVATLALGIGANTAVYSVVDGILLRPLPYPEADRLVLVCETHPSVSHFCIAAPPTVDFWAREARSLETVGLARTWPFVLRTEEGGESVRGGYATAGFFAALRVQPVKGRLFTPAEVGPAGGQRALLSYSVWQERFGGVADIVGRTVTLDQKPHEIVGVLPAGFEAPTLEEVEIWTPLPFALADEENRDWRGFVALGRLAAGVDLKTAGTEIATLQRRLARELPASHEGWGARVVSLQDWIVGPVRPKLLVFLAAVFLVLLIACANVAHLLLARATARRRELAVRTAVGAEPRHLLRLTLAEGAWLSVAGTGFGSLLAFWLLEVLIDLAPGGIPRLDEVAVDGRILVLVVGLAVFITVLFGLLPMLVVRRSDWTAWLREGQPQSGSSGGGLRGALVVAEVAAALMLLVGAALLGHSFVNLLHWDPGFETERLLTVWLLSSEGKYPQARQVWAVHRRAADAVAALPGVERVGMASAGPLFGGRETARFVFEDRPTPVPGEEPTLRWFDVDPGFFPALGVPVMQGRSFDRSDSAGAPPVALINETGARRFFGDESPLGVRVRALELGGTMEIVGVVRDIRPFPPGAPVEPEIYWPYAQRPRWATYLTIRTAGDPGTLVEPIRSRLRQVDPDLQASGWLTLQTRRGRQLRSPRFTWFLIGVFAAVAATLATVGVYGLLAYSVAQRRHELGVRLALGADRRAILAITLARGLRWTSMGIVLGGVGAVFLTRLLGSLLHGVGPGDPASFVVAGLALLGVASLGCWVPAHRASRTDPTVVLRAD
jgi:predicted permease